MSPGSQAVIVPLNVLAFAVNEKDAHDATPFFSGANTVFIDQLGPNQAFLGANVSRGPMGPPLQPLEAGVHVHWALPSALTKSSNGADGNLSFKPVPNRWLVHRFVISGSQAARSSWVVLSDLLNNNLPSGQASITLPTYATPSGQNYQYSGQAQTFTQQWTEPVIPAGRQFATLTGMQLTAVASGQSVFASFYPNCRGVFGFTDGLSDVKLSPGASANLMYVVTGWYSDNTLDPLYGGLTLKEIQDQLSWTFNDQTAQATPSFSLYQGSVQNVVWHPGQTYLPDYSTGTPTIDLNLSIGNNPPEAISCYLQKQLNPTLPYFQVLLNAYFEGLLSKLTDPKPDQLARLAEELQENGFQAIKSEYIYTIVREVVTEDQNGNPITTYVQADSLPARLGDALNLLNSYVQTLQLLQESVTNYHWQLFADWYRIFLAVGAQQQNCYDIAYQKYNHRSTLTGQVDAANTLVNNQIDVARAQLPNGCLLQKTLAPRFWRANDLVFLLAGEGLPSTKRYDDGGQYVTPGNLSCRLDHQYTTGATANQVTVTAANFVASGLPLPNGLPAADVFNNMLFEALLLNANLLSAITGVSIGYADVQAALLGQSKVLTLSGTSPLLLSVACWQNNPFVPLMAYWQAEFQPIFPTTDNSQQQIYRYPNDFFTSQFMIEQNNGGAIDFTPPTDPASGNFSQKYEGVSILSASVIDGFVRQLSKSSDPTSQQCLQTIEAQNMAMQAFSGINSAFLMQDQGLQLNIGVPADSEYYPITQAIADAVGGYASIAPNFNSFYNPVRAGYLKFNLALIDVFGQKATVKPATITIAQSLTIGYQGQPVPDLAFVPPRISQAARLLFRFLSADTTELDEMNMHPGTNPICGWLLPNHLNGSLFIYDAQGASLGSLFLKDDITQILWQSAPGNDRTINQSVQQVMQDQQPQLRDLVIALSQSNPQYFNDFVRAIDRVNGFIEPQDLSTNNDLAVLIGRPMAIVQVSLALELMGTPQYNQSWSVLGLAGSNSVAETDNNFTKVDFPVVLGDLQRLNDGLIGYFRFGQQQYDWTNFYTMGALESSGSGVQIPTQNTITLNAHPGPGGDSLDGGVIRLLLLIDPRADIHATTGILPTKSIRIPSDMFADTLNMLEMTFHTAPILGGSTALSIPLPTESGYQWSWVQARKTNGKALWERRGDIGITPPVGLWNYTPQTILEGWLRLNPDIMTFDLFNPDGKAILTTGINNNLTLMVTNRQGRAISFSPGPPVPEGAQPNGAIFYIHFGNAVPQDKVAAIVLQAEGWSFTNYTDPQYGSYWAATPSSTQQLAGGGAISINASNVDVETTKQQITINFDYYSVTNINDGVYQDAVNIVQS